MLIKEERWNRAVVWENYKAGVVNADTGLVIVPIRFDEVHWRIQTFSSPGPGIPPKPPLFVGFACFTDDGESIAYDSDGNIDKWRDWEKEYLVRPHPPTKSLSEVEQEIVTRFNGGADRDELTDLLYTRKHILNFEWRHTPDNVKAISRVNDRLNDAIRDALAMGQNLEKTLSGQWTLEIEVYPEWDGESIQNIIVELGRWHGVTDHSPCFKKYATSDRTNDWDFKTATHDDGNSWDEGGFERPAYQDCYFVRPFQELAYDNYILGFSDLLSIKTFQINILITKEASK